MNAKSEISEDPSVMRGEAVFKGTRVPIANVLASIEAGFGLEQLREAYPFLTPELVRAAQHHGIRRQTETAPRREARSSRILISSERIPLPPLRG
jgi:uncharacterized protein (DUF433 family)